LKKKRETKQGKMFRFARRIRFKGGNRPVATEAKPQEIPFVEQKPVCHESRAETRVMTNQEGKELEDRIDKLEVDTITTQIMVVVAWLAFLSKLH